MYRFHITCNDVLSALCANHKVANKSAVKKAYAYAEKKHQNQTRKTGEPYIMHPLKVARFIAEWGFDSDVVAAALLHDVVEDCHTSVNEIREEFGTNVANMVDTLTAVNKELAKAQGLTPKELDAMSDARLQRTISEKALFIKVADRLDNLHTIRGVKSEEKRIGKAQHTREILIPMVRREGAYQLVDMLEELCLQIEHESRYAQIMRVYQDMCRMNAKATRTVIDLFTELFGNKSTLIPHTLAPYQDYIVDFTCAPRSAISMFRQLNRNARNIRQELPALLTKNQIALYDLTLIISDSVSADSGLSGPLDLFYRYYTEVLAEKGICILDSRRTTYGDAHYLILCDEMDNQYRLFLKTEEELLHYRLGHVIDSAVSLSFAEVDEIDPRNTYNQKIKVFKRDGSELYIDSGATVLDFAFAIHSELGLHFKYAMIDGCKTQLPAYTRLNDGDTVTIITSEEETARIQWFNYLKTSRAVHHLVKHLS